MKLFFILGREPALSAAEIFSVFGRELDPETSTRLAQDATLAPEALVTNLPDELSPARLMSMLGGTIKIGTVQNELPIHISQESLITELVKTIQQSARYTETRRIHFGISAYATDARARSTLRTLGKHSKKLGMEIKRLLKEDGKQVRWVTSRAPSLSSVVVETNKLLKEGVELVLLAGKDTLLVGHTATVQPFRDLERRDFPRPGRDAKSGMLPPKLARMLVNLAAVPQDAVLLDPFCGSGTLLGEALLLGYTQLIGSDLDSTAVQNTNRNLDWLTKSGLAMPTAHARNVKLFESDIKDVTEHIEPNSIDAIATETYLGPPLKGNESRASLEQNRDERAKLFKDTLQAFHTILKKDGRAIIAFPLLRYKKEVLHTPILDSLDNFGFHFIDPLPMQVPVSLRGEFGRNGKTLVYGRPNQKVWREIAIIQKT